MSFQFEQTNNQEIFHNDANIQYFAQITFDADSELLLDRIFGAFGVNEENRREYFLKIKQYYLTKGIFHDDFEGHLDKFLDINWGSAKGAYLELLSYKLIESYCEYEDLFKECKVNYDGEMGPHPYDIIKINENEILLIDIKFSVNFLKKRHLDYLVAFINESMVTPFLMTLDYKERMELKLKYIQRENSISNNRYIDNINLISIDEYSSAILHKNCILNY